jgi:hypothetical protein
MPKKTRLTEAQKRIAGAAKAGAAEAKYVASDALGAAATAAAGVVLQRVSEALGQGQEKVEKAVPADHPGGTPKRRPGVRKSAISPGRAKTVGGGQ